MFKIKDAFKAITITGAILGNVVFPVNAYYADAYGNRENIDIDKTSAFDEQENDKEFYQEEINLTFEEKVNINHNQNDNRWFDIESECSHNETEKFDFYDDIGHGYEITCATCDQVIKTWYDIIYDVSENEENEEQEYIQDNTIQYESDENYNSDNAECDENIDEQLVVSTPEEIENSEVEDD